MLDQLQRQGLALSWKTGNDKMEGNGSDLHQDKARRFRDAALPYLDDVYTLARYLLRDTAESSAEFAFVGGVNRDSAADQDSRGVIIRTGRVITGRSGQRIFTSRAKSMPSMTPRAGGE